MALWDDLKAYYQCSSTVDTWGGYTATFNSVSVGSGTGKFGDSWEFASAAAYVSLGTTIPITSSGWTVMAWGYNLRPDSAYRTLFYNGQSGANGSMHFITQITTAVAGNWSNSTFVGSGTALAAASYTGWHHYCATFNGTNVTLYVDGVAIGTTTPTWPGGHQVAQIGGDTYGEGFAERLDDVAVWGRQLASAEVSQIYNAGNAGDPLSSLIGLEAELRSYYEASNVHDSWNVIDLTKGSEVSITPTGAHFSQNYDKEYFGFGTNNGNSYLRKVGGIPVAAANNMTFACWAKDILGTGDKNLVTFANGEALIYVDNASNELGVYDGAFYSSGVSFPYGLGWRHIAATYESSSGVTTFYIDGAPVGSVTRTLSFVGLEYIGGLQGSARQFAAGLDDIVVWERKLSESEILNVCNASKSGFSPFYKLIPGRQINDNNDEIGWLELPLTNNFNKLNYHMNTAISASASSSYSQDFESTSIGSLPSGFTTFGNQNWEVTGSDAHAGSKSAGSNPALNHNQSTSLAYTASLGSPQTLTFWWKVSSEGSYDWLTFYIDGAQQDRISGSPAWAQKSYSLPAGSSVLLWTYSKDGSGDSGQDAAWIDDINIGTPAGVTTPDGSGNGHDATLYNILTADTGSFITLYSGSMTGGDATKFTASLNFNGSTSKLDTGVTPNDVGIVSSNEKSIMFWASSSAWVNYKPFFSMGTNSTRQDFTLVQRTDGDIQLNLWDDDLTFTPPSTSGWHHYACTYDNGSNVVYVYIDGQLAGSKNLGGALNTSNANNILIGAGQHYWASHFFSGSIQEFSLFSSELSAQNVLDVYNHQYPKIVGGAGSTSSVQNLWGSVVHNYNPPYSTALNMWGSVVHNYNPPYAAALNMWGSVLHGGPAVQTASVANMWGSIVHNTAPPYAVALNMWGSVVHDYDPHYVTALNMWGSIVHSGSSAGPTPPGPLPVISASNPTTKLVESKNLGYVFNTYRVDLLSVQRSRTTRQVPFKLGTKGKQSLRNRTNTEFTGSS